MVCKAGKALNFKIQRNLKTSELNLKKTAYLTCVRPILEYACAVWDPSQARLINKIEKIQNRAARFVLGRYTREGRAALRWKMSLGGNCFPRVGKSCDWSCFFRYIMIKQELLKKYFKEPHYRSSKTDHVFKIRELSTRMNLFVNSFFVRSVKEWNRLSAMQVCCKNEELFMLFL